MTLKGDKTNEQLVVQDNTNELTANNNNVVVHQSNIIQRANNIKQRHKHIKLNPNEGQQPNPQQMAPLRPLSCHPPQNQI